MKRILALLLCLSLVLPCLALAEGAEDELDADELFDLEEVDLELDDDGNLILSEDIEEIGSEDESYYDESLYTSSDASGHFPVEEWEINSLLPEEDVLNILLIGVNSRPTQNSKEGQSQLLRDQMGDKLSYRKRSDVVMILSIDTVFGTLKITSISRDLLVEIPYAGGMGYWTGPINEAFAVAHNKNGRLDYATDTPERLIKTVNHNFGMNIRYFVATNFYGVEEIIEYFGGVDVELTKQEASYINQYISKNARTMKRSYDMHSEGRTKLKLKNGVQHLDGLQGLVFARYRTIAGVTDIVRTGRTRRLLQALAKPVAEKLKNRELDFLDVLMNVQQYFVTNINIQAIFNKVWPAVRDSDIMSDLENVTNIIEEYRIPGEKGFGYEGSHVKISNMKQAAEGLQEFIYGQIYGFDK